MERDEIDQLGVEQNRIARMALNAPRYASVEALKDDMGWSTFRERHMKAILRYKARLERMENTRIAQKIDLWNVSTNWEKTCMNIADRSGMLVMWVHRFFEGRERLYEWKVMNRSREGLECDVEK